MSRRVTAEEYEEQDGWIARLRDRWFGDGEEEEEEENFGAQAPPPPPPPTPPPPPPPPHRLR